jgi:hypothetical protein
MYRTETFQPQNNLAVDLRSEVHHKTDLPKTWFRVIVFLYLFKQFSFVVGIIGECNFHLFSLSTQSFKLTVTMYYVFLILCRCFS